MHATNTEDRRQFLLNDGWVSSQLGAHSFPSACPPAAGLALLLRHCSSSGCFCCEFTSTFVLASVSVWQSKRSAALTLRAPSWC